MIVSSAPLRVSFSGGGTDYLEYYENKEGIVFGSAIDKRVYVFVNELSSVSKEKIRFTYKITESVSNLDDLNHPAMREILRYFGIKEGINIGTLADLPGNTGLGSSSAFTVAAIAACAQFVNFKMSTKQIVDLAISIERNTLCEIGGVQDQLHAAYGSLRTYFLNSNLEFTSIDHLDNEFNDYFTERSALIFTGTDRFSASFAVDTQSAIKNPRKIMLLDKSAALTRDLSDYFISNENPKERYSALAKCVKDNWSIKKEIIGQGDHSLMKLEKDLEKVALAWKLCGAGGSGFALVLFENPISKNLMNLNLHRFSLTNRGIEVATFD